MQATPRLSEDKVKQCVDPKLNNDYPPKAIAKVFVTFLLTYSIALKIDVFTILWNLKCFSPSLFILLFVCFCEQSACSRCCALCTIRGRFPAKHDDCGESSSATS